MNLTRNRDGTMYHRMTCRYANPEMIWEWAKEKMPQDIVSIAYLGVYPCKVCDPLGDAVITPLTLAIVENRQYS